VHLSGVSDPLGSNWAADFAYNVSKMMYISLLGDAFVTKIVGLYNILIKPIILHLICSQIKGIKGFIYR
jgi:hypothetical protein